MRESYNIENMLKMAFKDPISKILLKYSRLTPIQFETFIIDILIDNAVEKEATYDEKKIYRSKKVSRGSFSRTLSQCRRNIISSIFTILLLNYVGILEGSPLEDFQILSNRLRDYSFSVINSDSEKDSEHLINVERELLAGIEKLSKPSTMKSL